MSDLRLVLGTRGSRLALAQADIVARALRDSVTIEPRIIRTTGDRITDVPLAAIGATGIFTRELDNALRDGEIDAAVHSLKDLPTAPPDGIRVVAVLAREDPADVLAVRAGGPTRLEALPAGATIGTSSLRRRALLALLRPDLDAVELRGNLDTRLARLDKGDFDGIIVAAAGLRRLGRFDENMQRLTAPDWLPAPGQGALAITMRADDERYGAFAALDHAPTHAAVAAERALLRRLDGGCQVPIGALATVHDGRLALAAVVADYDGSASVRGELDGEATEPARLGTTLAELLLRNGAAAILERVRDRQTLHQPPAAP